MNWIHDIMKFVNLHLMHLRAILELQNLAKAKFLYQYSPLTDVCKCSPEQGQ